MDQEPKNNEKDKVGEYERLIFEIKGKYSDIIKNPDNIEIIPSDYLPTELLRDELPLNDLSEVQVIRHFTNLSRKNYGVDVGFYPLGSCTMKYNPKINETVAALEGFLELHPYSEISYCQGALELMYELEKALCEITGMDAFTLQPAAGAHGELTAIMIAKKYFKGKRTEIIVPDTSHGTNPASSAMAGFTVTEIKSNSKGMVNIDELKNTISEKTAIFMVTNPNTLGLFEENIQEIADVVHSKGALFYCDGANLNGMVGISRPGDQGFDMMHVNLHKTFSTPHGGGGPGSGPVGVKKFLEKYLPVPRIRKTGHNTSSKYTLDYDFPDSIGMVKAFYGNFLVCVKAYAYILALGADGLKKASIHAILNANYIREKLKDTYYLPYPGVCCHEVVFSGEEQLKYGVHTTDIAKRLLDFGIHPPTIYFPLIVKEALMIEPTETESKETLDYFIRSMKKIADECKKNPEIVRSAPHTTPVGRLDGVLAARKPDIRWAGPGC